MPDRKSDNIYIYTPEYSSENLPEYTSDELPVYIYMSVRTPEYMSDKCQLAGIT